MSEGWMRPVGFGFLRITLSLLFPVSRVFYIWNLSHHLIMGALYPLFINSFQVPEKNTYFLLFILGYYGHSNHIQCQDITNTQQWEIIQKVYLKKINNQTKMGSVVLRKKSKPKSESNKTLQVLALCSKREIKMYPTVDFIWQMSVITVTILFLSIISMPRTTQKPK